MPDVLSPSLNGVKKLRPIDRVRQAYQKARDMVRVPEWPDEDGNPLEVFFTPLTYAEHQQIIGYNPQGNHEYNVYTLIAKARDAEGAPLFTPGDLATLKGEASYNVIIRIVSAINELGGLASVDEVKSLLGEDHALRFRVQLSLVLGKTIEEIAAMPTRDMTLYLANALLCDEEAQVKMRHILTPPSQG